MSRFKSGEWSGTIRTACTQCGCPLRHRVAGRQRYAGPRGKADPDRIRLRDKDCPKCGGRARPLWWVKKYPRRAAEEFTELARRNNPVVAHHLEGL